MKNPFLNAVLAAAYIVGIVLVMNVVVRPTVASPVLIPMVVLGLFVLSATVMGFLFLYEPFCLYFDGKKQEAVVFFGKTVATFACLVAAFLVALELAAFY